MYFNIIAKEVIPLRLHRTGWSGCSQTFFTRPPVITGVTSHFRRIQPLSYHSYSHRLVKQTVPRSPRLLAALARSSTSRRSASSVLKAVKVTDGVTLPNGSGAIKPSSTNHKPAKISGPTLTNQKPAKITEEIEQYEMSLSQLDEAKLVNLAKEAVYWLEEEFDPEVESTALVNQARFKPGDLLSRGLKEISQQAVTTCLLNMYADMQMPKQALVSLSKENFRSLSSPYAYSEALRASCEARDWSTAARTWSLIKEADSATVSSYDLEKGRVRGGVTNSSALLSDENLAENTHNSKNHASLEGATGPTHSAGATGPTHSAGATGPTHSAGATGPTHSVSLENTAQTAALPDRSGRDTGGLMAGSLSVVWSLVLAAVSQGKTRGFQQTLGAAVEEIVFTLRERGIVKEEISSLPGVRPTEKLQLLAYLTARGCFISSAESSEEEPQSWLDKLRSGQEQETVNVCYGCMDGSDSTAGPAAALRDQLDQEVEGIKIIPVVTNRSWLNQGQGRMDKDVAQCLLNEFFDQARQDLSAATDELMKTLDPETSSPFFYLLEPKETVEVFLNVLKRMVYSPGSAFGSSRTVTKHLIADELRARFVAKTKLYDPQSMRALDEYVHSLLKTPTRTGSYRAVWEQCLQANDGKIFERIPPSMDMVKLVSYKFYKLFVENIHLDCHFIEEARGHVLRDNKSPSRTPALYEVVESKQIGTSENLIKLHPVLSELGQYSGESVTFTTELPMLAPPLPWTSSFAGGYYLTPDVLIRKWGSEKEKYGKVYTQKPLPHTARLTLDSVSALASTPWAVNERMLGIIISIVNGGEGAKLGLKIPVNTSLRERHLSRTSRLSRRNRGERVMRDWGIQESVISLAQQLIGRPFWMPMCMDFRGRVYPRPTQLNHYGNDLTKSLLKFANPQPLGQSGFSWLLKHAQNLHRNHENHFDNGAGRSQCDGEMSGLSPHHSFSAEELHANQLLPDILSSAADPYKPDAWWRSAKMPFQTLACCFEIKEALDSGDPANFLSNLPIHQDGSCNGLQHYVALSRDSGGAAMVNMVPADHPRDIYADVLKLVQASISHDVGQGHSAAVTLEGHVTRSVVKQAVMASLYGVSKKTSYANVSKKLRGVLPAISDSMSPGYRDIFRKQTDELSEYLCGITGEALEDTCTPIREVQEWLRLCAANAVSLTRAPVQWVSPLGLTVLQPYSMTTRQRRSFLRPDHVKHVRAFPANFIHSLDASHMMLTALQCFKEGITFASVHDSYWSHAADVPRMNKILREQFVELYQQPILTTLAHGFSEDTRSVNVSSEGTVAINNSKMTASRWRNIHQILLARLAMNPPLEGELDIRSVLKATFFFK